MGFRQWKVMYHEIVCDKCKKTFKAKQMIYLDDVIIEAREQCWFVPYYDDYVKCPSKNHVKCPDCC